MEDYQAFYQELGRGEIGCLITGFAFVHRQGRAMQAGQAGLDDDAKIPAFRRVTDAVHALGGRMVAQIAHTGRQTSLAATGGKMWGASARPSPYFRDRPQALGTDQARAVVGQFVEAARRAREAGFDGVQVHAAHGYLVHQFLLPSVNDRKDEFGIDPGTGIGTAFLGAVLDGIRARCGREFPLLVKVSGSVDAPDAFDEGMFVSLVRFLDVKKVDGIEVSWGTMDQALNIMRGKSLPLDLILKYNPRYKTQSRLKRALWKRLAAPWLARSLKPFSGGYNLDLAALAKKHTRCRVICVGGFRAASEMEEAVVSGRADLVSLCRPFLCEPGLAQRLKTRAQAVSRCTSCNRCSVMCDSGRPTKCYLGDKEVLP
jgi:2,4-dienoyl-CoA reductase-like NADH-dependent reductase (Old Yellow Enzyme family)